jgi:hypothetical protein
LVQDARLLIEMGKLDEAEAKLRLALKQNPEDRNAFYYLAIIDEARYAEEARKREFSAQDGLVQGERAWNAPTTRERIPTPNPWATTNLINTSEGRRAIYQKLDKIIINEVLYNGLPLSEVVRDLSDQARKRDPDKHGINFIINSGSGVPAVGGVDPNTGQPVPPAKPVNINDAVVRLHLINVRLIDVIDAVAKVAEPPLKYSIEDYAVVFSQHPNESELLFTRVFKVNLRAFSEGLLREQARVQGGSAPDQAQRITPDLLREYFSRAGVDFGTNRVGIGGAGVKATGLKESPPPPTDKALYFNDQTGMVLARTTIDDLDIIERAIQRLNTSPAQVVIEIKFAEIDSSELEALGLDAVSDLRESEMAVTISDWNGVVTDPHAFDAGKPIENFVNRKPQSLPGKARLLTSSERETILKAVERTGGDLLAAPRVTTLSGRQAQIQVIDVKDIVLLETAKTQRRATSGSFVTKPVPTGPCVDVVPNVLPDGRTIELTAIPSWTEFLGYDDAKPFQPNSDMNGMPVIQNMPLPHFRLRRAVLTAKIPDGQTLVAAGFGELPATKPRTAPKSSKQLLILITPTIVDPAGNRVHPE